MWVEGLDEYLLLINQWYKNLKSKEKKKLRERWHIKNWNLTPVFKIEIYEQENMDKWELEDYKEADHEALA